MVLSREIALAKRLQHVQRLGILETLSAATASVMDERNRRFPKAVLLCLYYLECSKRQISN